METADKIQPGKDRQGEEGQLSRQQELQDKAQKAKGDIGLSDESQRVHGAREEESVEVQQSAFSRTSERNQTLLKKSFTWK